MNTSTGSIPFSHIQDHMVPFTEPYMQHCSISKDSILKQSHPIQLILAILSERLYHIELPQVCRDVAGSISINYSMTEIYNEEEQRLKEIRERLNNQVSVFTSKPVVFLELESPYFDFEPEDVHFLDTLGTLYNTMRVSDNWGKLTVDKIGCLVSNNYKYLRITAKGLKIDKNHIYWRRLANNSE